MPDRTGAPHALVILLCCALASCAPAPTPTLPPTPARLAVTPGLERFAARQFRAWADEAGVPDFDLEIWPEAAAIEAVDESQLAAVVTLVTPPEGWFTAPIGAEGVALIVNSANRVRALDLEDLAEIFTGRAETWEPFGGSTETVLPVIPLPGDGLREAFENDVMQGIAFSGGARLAPDPEAALAIVDDFPGAIALVPFTAVEDSVRLIRIDGVLPAEDSIANGRYPLSRPILLLAPEEPSGDIRDWIVWLQAKQGP
jgi:phosphate transport system substrate-binding protein